MSKLNPIDAAKARIKSFSTLTASAVSKKKTNKQAAKRIDKAAKTKPATVKGKDAGSFHDKLEAKLDKLAKKHKISVSLRRNKRKLPVVILGKLKNKTYGEVVRIFKSIPNSSPAPQKLLENGASFTIFGKRKMTAADIEEENKRKKFLADESDENAEADGTAEDTSSEEEDYEDEGDEPETTEEEDEANINAMIEYINTNNISREAVNKIFDDALKIYADDLKTNGPIDDSVGFIYNTLGPDDAKNAFKALVNKETLTSSTNRYKAK